MVELTRCKCGGKPDIYTRFAVATQRYQGEVCCSECGEQVLGKLHLYNREEAVDDAVEEWNVVMEEK